MASLSSSMREMLDARRYASLAMHSEDRSMIFQALQFSLRLLASGLIIGMAWVAPWSNSGAIAWPRVQPPVQFTAMANATAAVVEDTECSSFPGFQISNANVRCGYLVVPETRQNPQSRMIKVAFAIVNATSPQPHTDPIVFLPGGPGDGAIDAGWVKWPKGSLAARDLILVDPRGVGYSQPTMKCPWKIPSGTSIQNDPPSPAETRTYAIQWAQHCRDLLVRQGFDLTGYDSTANANDLEDLRQALGYAKWNLYGVSYGTRTALETMRAYPQGVRSVVLDSLLPPQIDRNKTDLTSRASALSTLFAACRADLDCNRDYPNLEIRFNELLRRAEQNPIQISLRDPVSDQNKNIWVTSGTVFQAASQMLVNPAFIQIAPIAIEQIRAGDTAVLGPLFAPLIPRSNQAISYSVLCRDGGALFYPDQAQAALDEYPGLESFFTETEGDAICTVWRAGQPPPAERQPVQSDIPALVITGHYDPLTPPAFARVAAGTLSRSFSYEFAAYGHAASYKDCPKAMLAAFLDDPTTAPDSSCMAQAKGLPFITDVYLNPGVFNLYLAAQMFNLWLSMALGIITLVFLSAIVTIPMTYWRSGRHEPDKRALSTPAGWVLWLVALLNLGFGMGVYLLVKRALVENYGWVTLFGFSPSSTRYLFILPWLTTILTIVLLALTCLAWKNRWWGHYARSYYTVGTLAAIGFDAFLLYAHVLSL